MQTVQEQEVEWRTYDHGEHSFRRRELSAAGGGEELGCSFYELPPGARSWPYHYHTANEEALYVLDGTGVVRGPDGDEELTPGTYVTLPADESGSHQVVADADQPLRYLMVSTMNDPDVTVYPEMDKIGVFAGAAPGGRGERSVHGYYPRDAAVGYWEE